MKNFEQLENFISSHENWKELLKAKPYALKSIKQCPWDENLWILNYNLFESDLTLPIVKQCRGTVIELIDGKARVVCAPYLKFFNYGDPNCDEIDYNSAVAREKVDGQLIKAFKYNGFLFWVSNGDFGLDTNLVGTSSTIKDYKDLLYDAIISPYKEHIPSWYRPQLFKEPAFEVANIQWMKEIPEGWTLMFELCSPYNPIIVKYNEVKLYFHGARDSEGNEHEPEEIAKQFDIPYEIPQKFDFKNINEALDTINQWKGTDHEGIVVCDSNYHRIKVKCSDYLEEKFNRDFIDSLGRDDTIFKLIIEESYDDFLPTHPEIKERLDYMILRLEEFKANILRVSDDAIKMRQNLGDQKSFAEWVNKEHRNLNKIYFGAAKYGNSETWYNKLFNSQIKDCQGNEYKHFIEWENLFSGNRN